MKITAQEFRKACDTAEGYIDLGLLDEAADVLEELPTQAKISKEVIALHMRILVKSGQPLKASYLGENICFGDPDNVGLNIEVGQLKRDAGEFTDALKWLTSVESKCRDSAQFHLLRAKCHASLGDLEACVLALREAHKIDPDLRMQSLDDSEFEASPWFFAQMRVKEHGHHYNEIKA
jgi:predicted Zn-dependent protease